MIGGKPWYTIDWVWFAISAGVSALVAVATGFLAVYTYVLAKETRNSLEQGQKEMNAQERRHMDGFLPHIALIVRYLQEGDKDDHDVRSAHHVIAKKIGPGFAQNIDVAAPAVDEIGGYIVDPPAGLASGDSFLVAAQPFHPDGPHLTDVAIEYRDAFGRRFESRIAGIATVGSHYTWRRIDTHS